MERLHITSTWICSALSFPSENCPQPHVLKLIEGETDSFIYSFALQKEKKKKKRILSAEVFFYRAVVCRSGKAGHNQREGIARTHRNVLSSWWCWFFKAEWFIFRGGWMSFNSRWYTEIIDILSLSSWLFFFYSSFTCPWNTCFAQCIQPKHFNCMEPHAETDTVKWKQYLVELHFKGFSSVANQWSNTAGLSN